MNRCYQMLNLLNVSPLNHKLTKLVLPEMKPMINLVGINQLLNDIACKNLNKNNYKKKVCRIVTPEKPKYCKIF